jgi:alpha-1,3-rhamnosyl/mannosyltransferase
MKVILAVDSVRFPLTGIGRYTYELAHQLQQRSDIKLSLFANGQFIRELPSLSQMRPSRLGQLRRLLLKSRWVTNVYNVIAGVRNRSSLRGHGDAVFHGPGFYLPKFGGPSVATFHDLSMFTWAHCHPPERVRYMQQELKLTLQRASMLITDSEFNRRELAAYFNYPLEKIRAIPLACSEDFHPRDVTLVGPVLQRLGLTPGGYTLFAGTIEPRKNIRALLDAYSALPQSIRYRWPLVLAGYRGWQSEQLHARIEEAVKAGWAHYLGYVADVDLPHLFAGARLFVFPSHYEGFGLPVLEAMASGVPVVCSNASSLPEVAGDAAAMCAPDDVDGLRECIANGLENDLWRRSAIEKGLRRATSFSWRRCADETTAVYWEVAARNSD